MTKPKETRVVLPRGIALEEARALVAFGLRNGLLKIPKTPITLPQNPINLLAPDISPDLKRAHLEAKK